MIPTLAVAGGADPRTRSTVAVNIAVGLSALGHEVELVDGDRDAPLLRALAGSAAAAPQAVVLQAGAGLGISVRPAAGAPPGLRLLGASATLDDAQRDLLRAAMLVVVPLDATPASRAALDMVAATLQGGTGGLLIVLSRQLPRETDRWSLVEDLGERYPDSLSPVTVPMGRRSGAPGATSDSGDATLYAPTGRAAKAYRALARDLVARSGLAPPRETM